MATYVNRNKGSWKGHQDRPWTHRQEPRWDSWHSEETRSQHQNAAHSQPLEQQYRGSKAKYYTTNHAPTGQKKGKGSPTHGSPSHQHQQAAYPPPPTPTVLRSKQLQTKDGERMQQIMMPLCSMCRDNGFACGRALCTDFQNGQCEKGKDGSSCKKGLCHSCEGYLKTRNVPKTKPGRKRNPAVLEHQNTVLFAAHGFVLKNSFYDEPTSLDEDRERRRAHSAGADRSKDPGERQNCHHCMNDAKSKSTRTQEVYAARILTMVYWAGMPMEQLTGPKLDTTWMEEDGDLTSNPLVLPNKGEPIPAYMLQTFRKELNRSRDSASTWDPMGETPMCQKALCWHWMRGGCKSQRATCKFAHCHAGGFEKPGNGVEEEAPGRSD